MFFVVAATATVCGVGAGGLGLWTFQSVRDNRGPARQAAEEFLRDLSTGDADGAYGRLCTRARERMGRSGFTDWFHAQPRIDRYRITDVSIAPQDNGFTGTVTAEVTWESGVVAEQKLAVATDDGRWRVCGDPV